MSSVVSSVFMNGNSQAVRIPQEFRFSASRVQVSRNEAGDLGDQQRRWVRPGPGAAAGELGPLRMPASHHQPCCMVLPLC